MSVTNDFAEHEKTFFQDPAVEPQQPQSGKPVTHGVLYLLRRDIKKCIEAGAVFPTAMAILAGIDLLAKFYKGSDNYRSGVHQRFEGFVKEYFQPLDKDEPERLWQLRNAMMHSFGLYSEQKAGGRVKAKYRFAIDPGESGRPDKGQIVEDYGDDNYYVGIATLKKRFEQAVHGYHGALKEGKDKLQEHFEKMWDKYGCTTDTLDFPWSK